MVTMPKDVDDDDVDDGAMVAGKERRALVSSPRHLPIVDRQHFAPIHFC